MRLKRFLLLLPAALLCCCALCAAAEAGVILKMTAENPSQYESRDVAVKSFLPYGVKSENIINKGDLEVAYDVKQGKYYVYKDVRLGPQESVTYEIEVEDIWRIDEAYIASLVAHSRDLSEKLGKTEYSAVSKQLKELISADAADIIKRQDAASIDKAAPVEHINAYEANKAVLDKMRRDVGTMENLVIGLGGDAGKVMGESATGTKALDEVAAEADRAIEAAGLGSGTAAAGKPKTLVLKIEVSNPSKTEARKVPVNYYLPPEIRKDDIVDAKELEPRLDFERSVYYMYHPGVELGPGESKVFDIVVKDKWTVSEAKLLALKLKAASMAESLSGTSEQAAMEGLAKEAMDGIDRILNRQAAAALDESTIAEYYSQQQQVGEIEKTLGRMEDLLRRAGVKTGITALSDEKLRAIAEDSGVSEERLKQIQNMLVKGKSDYGTGPDPKGVKLLAGTIFKGKAPSTATTWRIIFIIIIFLAVVGGIYFLIWSAQVAREKKIEKVGDESNDNKPKEDNI